MRRVSRPAFLRYIAAGSPLSAPIVKSRGRTLANTSTAAPHNVTMPSGITAGDLLLVWFTRNFGLPTSTPSGWTQLAVVGSSSRSVLYGKIAAGGDTCAVPHDGSYWCQSSSWRISGCDSLSKVFTSTGVETADPDAISGLASADYLTLALFSSTGASTFTGYPAGYGDQFYTSNTPQQASAEKTFSSVTGEDPGTFTTTNSLPCSLTVMIKS